MTNSNKDKLNRLYGTDYLKQYKRLSQQVITRLNFLKEKFPDIVDDLPYNTQNPYDNINTLIKYEKIINLKYNNHTQGELF